MKLRSSRLASGLPMDWHERPTVGAARARRIGAPGFLAGMALGVALGVLLALLTVASL